VERVQSRIYPRKMPDLLALMVQRTPGDGGPLLSPVAVHSQASRAWVAGAEEPRCSIPGSPLTGQTRPLSTVWLS